MTEKGTLVLRMNVDEVVLGAGKIQLPVLVDDWTKSKSVTQYAVRGSLHPDTLIIAVENFTQKRVREGLLVYSETSKKTGRLIFDFAQLSSGIVYATAEDNIMLERAAEPPYINFTFGRNLYWYVKSQKEKAAGLHGGSKENDYLNSPKTPSKANGRSPRGRGRNGILSPKSPNAPHHNQLVPAGPGGAPPPPPLPAALRTLQLDANGVPMCGTPPPPLGGKKRQRKVRQLHWTKIPQNQLAGTIWREKGSPSRVAVDIDVDELESMFSLSPMKGADGAKLQMKIDGKAAKSAAEKQPLLDLKRANNGAVLLSQFKGVMDFGEIRNALLTMDTKNVLSIENLISLKYLFPLSDQERHEFVNFKGDITQYGPAENFYFRTLDVPRPDIRVQMLIFRAQYADVSQHLEAAVHLLRQGSQELVDSDKLAQILQLILKLGRALNDGSTTSAVGSASGFRLDSLSRLVDTKAKDKKTSILDYLVALVNRQKPELVEFWSETPYLEHVTKLPTETITEGLKEIKDNLDALKLELELISVNMTPEANTLAGELAVEIAAERLKVEDKSKTEIMVSAFSFDASDSASRSSSSSSLFASESGEETLVADKEIEIKIPVEFVDVPARHADSYFKAHMGSYYDETLSTYIALKKRYEAAVHTFEKAVRYFGEDPKSATPSAFFTLLTNFVDNWKNAKAKIDRQAAEEQRAALKAQREEEKRQLQLEKEAKKEREAQEADERARQALLASEITVEIMDDAPVESIEIAEAADVTLTIEESIEAESVTESESLEGTAVEATSELETLTTAWSASASADASPDASVVYDETTAATLQPWITIDDVAVEQDTEFVPFEEMVQESFLEF